MSVLFALMLLLLLMLYVWLVVVELVALVPCCYGVPVMPVFVLLLIKLDFSWVASVVVHRTIEYLL